MPNKKRAAEAALCVVLDQTVSSTTPKEHR
ncbi:MAG: hypothetical protein UY31_C0004G0004 [Candidatus Wolfebacteria bacterium GW2011_GWE1_48_7]|nr:MAG: hypothetical protein UX49_C0020G0007 [Candidatus Wolfebacteria bacterium GW2011_GWC2_46_275]KKU41575.1 MAG: hypothetical protein UX58_C0007G0016 [Candidatus Wolfebacteria bacterium GW2011_GWB2_46_69]KKU53510.1 MAG: hypothetical protein UX76_C0014G0006 [Candidatus Wolfebacteria bacterium GW2011_GWC1_47_103]KKU65857.1 MAG: hypothetical protein UX90_C0002G0233 [Candidatus Wolfebacteria bacterium GW2011_GWD2_47_17]KKU70832.1 MAG: hypothetical protein UX96_C0035G0003 [Candidatus Wolfebacteri